MSSACLVGLCSKYSGQILLLVGRKLNEKFMRKALFPLFNKALLKS